MTFISEMKLPDELPMEAYVNYLNELRTGALPIYHEIMGFGVLLTSIKKAATPQDLNAVEYMSKFFSYFCDKGDVNSVPKEVIPNFEVASNPENPFMHASLKHSTCTDGFVDLVISQQQQIKEESAEKLTKTTSVFWEIMVGIMCVVPPIMGSLIGYGIIRALSTNVGDADHTHSA